MSEKIRYYLEQSVTELEDLQSKGIFSSQELKLIMRKRTDFEHRISSRTVKPKDFLAYAAYEINVDRLRKKRVKRVGITESTDPPSKSSAKKGPSDWAGPRRTLFIFDRATRRFAGNIHLWMQYLEYAKSQKSINVINKIFTSILQLHPTKPELWIAAAKHEMDENASMKAARYVMQRGLRFNKDSTRLWLEYIKLELIYISKILARRKLLGLSFEEAVAENSEESGSQIQVAEDSDAVTEASVRNELKDLPDADMSKLQEQEHSLAVQGYMGLAVYDIAMQELPSTATRLNLSLELLDLFDRYPELDRQHMCKHILDTLMADEYKSAQILLLSVTLTLRHVSHDDPMFPDMVKLMILKYRDLHKDEKTTELKILVREHINEKYLQSDLNPELDSNIRLVFEKFIEQL